MQCVFGDVSCCMHLTWHMARTVFSLFFFVCKSRCSNHCMTYCTRTALMRCFRQQFCCKHRRLAYLLRRWVACGLGSVHAVYASTDVQLVIRLSLLWTWYSDLLDMFLAVCYLHDTSRELYSISCSLSANHVARIIVWPAVHALHSDVASVNSSVAGILVLHIFLEGGSPAVSEARINVCHGRHSCKDDIGMIHSNVRH